MKCNILNSILIIILTFGAAYAQNTNLAKIVEIGDLNNKKSEKLQFKKQTTIEYGDRDGYRDLYNVDDIKIDNDGSIYVLTHSTYKVYKFDKEGRLLFAVGGKGSGPGEMINPLNLYVTGNHEIFVSDIGKFEIIIYSKNGKYLRSIKLNQPVNDFVVLKSRNLLVQALSPVKKFIEFDAKGKTVNEFGEMIRGKNGMETMFLSGGLIGYENESIFFAANQPYLIEKFNLKGKKQLVLKKNLRYNIVKPDYEISKENDNTELLIKKVSETKIPQDICCSDNRVFYLTKENGDILSLGKKVDVYDYEGHYISSFELEKSTAKAISVSNDKLVVLFQSFNLPSKAGKKSNNDNPSIVVYNIINNKDVH